MWGKDKRMMFITTFLSPQLLAKVMTRLKLLE
jgi:hypothetical protein